MAHSHVIESALSLLRVCASAEAFGPNSWRQELIGRLPMKGASILPENLRKRSFPGILPFFTCWRSQQTFTPESPKPYTSLATRESFSFSSSQLFAAYHADLPNHPPGLLTLQQHGCILLLLHQATGRVQASVHHRRAQIHHVPRQCGSLIVRPPHAACHLEGGKQSFGRVRTKGPVEAGGD